MRKSHFNHAFFILLLLAGLTVNRFDSLYVFSASDLTSVQADDVFLAPTIPVVVEANFEFDGETLEAPFLESESIKPINIPEKHSSIPPPWLSA